MNRFFVLSSLLQSCMERHLNQECHEPYRQDQKRISEEIPGCCHEVSKSNAADQLQKHGRRHDPGSATNMLSFIACKMGSRNA